MSLNQEQGAVAWMYTNAQGKTVIVESDVPPYDDAVPLFKSESHAEQKPWVWLTDDEVSKLIDNEIGFNSCCGWEHEYTRAVEAKLKEVNS